VENWPNSKENLLAEEARKTTIGQQRRPCWYCLRVFVDSGSYRMGGCVAGNANSMCVVRRARPNQEMYCDTIQAGTGGSTGAGRI